LAAPLVADLDRWLRQERPKLSRGNDLAKPCGTHRMLTFQFRQDEPVRRASAAAHRSPL
jgi:hypothetical protein